MLVFAIIGALDRMVGNKLGLGSQFERGMMLIGNMALSLLGMIVIIPLLADLLAPCFDWIYTALGLDPSIIPAILFSNDLGGASLALEIARDDKLGILNGLVVTAMMGLTISFNIPYGLGVVEKERHTELFYGFLCGIITVPVGCFLSGLLLEISLPLLLKDLLPLLLFSVLLSCGLLFIPRIMVKVFSVFGFLIRVIITFGLIFGMINLVTKTEVIKGITDIRDGGNIILNSAVILSGALPLLNLLSRLLAKPIQKLGDLLKINSTSALGFITSIATNTPTFAMMNQMDHKGIMLNAAFIVSGSFTFGSHLAFTTAFAPDYVSYMIVGKLVSGLCGLALALLIYPRLSRKAAA